MNTFELMTELHTHGYTVEQAALLCTEHNNKEIYLAYAKEYGVSVKEANAIWKEAQPTKAKAKGFAAEYYEWLARFPRTEQEAVDYIMDPANSNNTHKHKSHYMNIWELTVAVRANLGEEPEAEPEQEEQSDEVKQAWSDLEAEMSRAKPRKTKVHPDKVSHLGNDELTRAYTEAFQSLNKKCKSA